MFLGRVCAKSGVTVYIDAEYSQLQPGVRLLALALMNIFNTERRYSAWYRTTFYRYKTFFCLYRASFCRYRTAFCRYRTAFCWYRTAFCRCRDFFLTLFKPDLATFAILYPSEFSNYRRSSY
jgi:hypothetical protein